LICFFHSTIGQTWQLFTSSDNLNGIVFAMAILDGRLVVAGSFTSPFPKIMVLNSTSDSTWVII